MRQDHAFIRRWLFSALGGKCRHCHRTAGVVGEGQMHVDHIHGGGSAHRRELYPERMRLNPPSGGAFRQYLYYSWRRGETTMGWIRANLQLLCRHCHESKTDGWRHQRAA